MDENTGKKSMENSTVEKKKPYTSFLEYEDRLHNEYSQHRHLDQALLDRVEK